MQKGALKLLKGSAAVFLLVLLCAWGLWRGTGHFAPASMGPEVSKLLIMAAEEVGAAWNSGRHPRQKTAVCPRFFAHWPLPPTVLKCNALFLKCLFEDRPLEFEGGRVAVHFEHGHLPYKIVSKAYSDSVAPGYALEIWLEAKGQRQRIWAEDTCSAVYLPQRLYGYGKNGHRWDNFGQHWFVDRHLATHREVGEWHQQTGKKLREPLSRDLRDHYKPVGSLYPDEMRDYCHFRGKQLASAPWLDAAFFLPADLDDPLSSPALRGPYPWTRWRTLVTVSDCLKIPARECRDKIGVEQRFSASPTWTGAFQALGGLPERVDNPLYPRHNLNLSSFYFSSASKVHAIAERGHWSGRGFQRSAFSLGTWELPEEVKHLRVGFRCMKQRYGSEKF